MSVKISIYDMGFSLLYEEHHEYSHQYDQVIRLALGLDAYQYDLHVAPRASANTPWVDWGSIVGRNAYRITDPDSDASYGYMVYQEDPRP